MDILLMIPLIVVCFAIVIVLLTACISVPLLLVDWLIFRVWLGRKSNKYDSFYDLSVLWLTRSYKLPFKMYERGAKYGWLGAGLMLISPAAIVTYSTAFCVQQVCFPSPQSEDEIPYKTHEDLVAITDLQDFPAFTYDHNEKHTDIWSGRKYVAIYFNFNKELSSEYIKKMKALCNDKDNVHWENKGDTCFIMSKVWDGKYIKAPVKDSKLGNRLELAIHKKGFEIYQGSAIDYRLEDFAEKDSLKKNAGVSFPKYRLVYYHCNVYRDTYEGDYLLLLDKKPSDAFIRNLEKSPKWKKCGNGIYECYYVAVSNHNGVFGARIKVDKNCRVVKIKYGT